jgi:hypothetical protein
MKKFVRQTTSMNIPMPPKPTRIYLHSPILEASTYLFEAGRTHEALVILKMAATGADDG